MSAMRQAMEAAALGAAWRPEAGTVVRRFRFPRTFPGFAGHFPDYPVLPAVVQILAARMLAETLWGRPLRLNGVENAKFLLQVQPEEEVRVELRERSTPGILACEARLWRGKALAASFALHLAEGAGDEE